MITVQFSISTPAPTSEQREQLAALLNDVTILNRRNGRFFVEAVDRRTDLQAALQLLNQWGKDPRIIGVWRGDGTRHPAFPNINLAEFIEVAPDRLDAEGNVLPRPVAFFQAHTFTGWSDKQ